ncbi:MAG: hypothetical protein H6658_04590 [Ardenticatenaceae bacterium]|nr:hypothetical protein [Ardenticatenaceae bacterium]
MEFGKRFNGLGMPVFTAFGWAGEETAIKYALSQLELFIGSLHDRLPMTTQMDLPFFGVNEANKEAYLAADKEVYNDGHISFNARPLSFEVQMVIAEKAVIVKGLARAVKDTASCHHIITQLGPEWTLRVQQMQIEEGTGEATHYQDLFKDSVKNFSLETASEVFNKALYLNSEDYWVTPVYLSRRYPAEQASVMGATLTQVMSEQVTSLMPAFQFLTGRVKTTKRKTKARTSRSKAAAPTMPEAQLAVDVEESFSYVVDLKPLHIRRGFINLTPEHWSFFALNARTETRNVTIYYDGIYDKKSAVWRLQPSEQARIVLSPAVQEWLEDNFSAHDQVKVTAMKLDGDEVQVSLTAVDE